MKNWKKVKLGELLTESRIISEKPDANKRLTVRLHTQGIEKRPFAKGKKGATKYFIRSTGQFIYGRQNLHKGAFGIIPKEFDGYESSADIPAFDVDESCLPEWIYYFFKKGDFYLKLESIAKGVGSKRINPSQIFNLNIFLPPIEEQRLLLDRIHELTKNLDKTNYEFEKQLEYINQLKQSIIEEAVIGKLTEDWRNQNNSIPHVSSEQSENMSRISDESFSDIPENWRLIELNDLIIKIEAGKSPRCEPFPADINEWGVIKISAISWGKFNESENKRLPLNIEPFIDKEIKPGDFIMTRSNTPELVGRSIVVGKNVRQRLLLNDKTLRLEFKDFINPEYFNLYNNSKVARSYYLKVLTGTSDSMKNISQGNIKKIMVSVPPIEEQRIIISKVSNLLIKCADLEDEAKINMNIGRNIFNSSLVDILGDDNNTITVTERKISKEIYKRNIKIDNKTMLMDLVELLQKHGKLHAEDLWKMSKFPKDIDAFYAELKHQIEDKKSIKEVKNEKSYLELA